MKINFDADYLAGNLVIAAILALAIAVLCWLAWNDIGQWQHPRIWLSLGAILIAGPAWTVSELRRRKGDD